MPGSPAGVVAGSAGELAAPSGFDSASLGSGPKTAAHDGGRRATSGGDQVRKAAASGNSGVPEQTPDVERQLNSGCGPVKVGALTYDVSSGEQVVSALGAKGIANVDPRQVQDALAAFINQHGGLSCHPVTPAYWTIPVTSNDSYANWDQAMCSAWTEDAHVVAAVANYNAAADVLPGCMQRAGTPLIRTSVGNQALAEDFNPNPVLIEPNWLSTDRAYRALVDQLAAHGFFTAGSRVGLLRYDTPTAKRVAEQVVRPQLARFGISVQQEFAFTNASKTSDVSQQSAEAQSAVLRFKSAGIDRVLIMDAYGGVAFAFMPAASAAGYQPQYGVTTDSQPVSIASNAPADQASRAVGIGWNGAWDVPFSQSPLRGRAAANTCLSIMAKAGVDLSTSANRGAVSIFCDDWLLLKAAADAAHGVDRQSILRGVNLLGASFTPASTFNTVLARGRHDGVAAVRWISYRRECSCFQYQGTNRRVA